MINQDSTAVFYAGDTLETNTIDHVVVLKLIMLSVLSTISLILYFENCKATEYTLVCM